MVYYIRFLKPPSFDVLKGVVRALVTVTTDLGDNFYPGSISLYFTVVTFECERDWQSRWSNVDWRDGMRAIWIEIHNLRDCPAEHLRLVINTRPTLEADDLSLDNILEVVSARSDSFGRGSSWEKVQADKRLQRNFRTSGGHEIIVFEETGESIARHVWDAGVVLATYLSQITSHYLPASLLAKLLHKSTENAPNIIELGSGCGIVGLELANICTSCNILLTDLPEAMEILNHNIEQANRASRKGSINAAVLAWDKALPVEVSTTCYDLVVISDCTYNADSIPALVQTAAALVERSPAALVLVSMKVRHESESVFFDLITDAGFAKIDHTSVKLSDRQRHETGQSLEAVDIYIYGKAMLVKEG